MKPGDLPGYALTGNAERMFCVSHGLAGIDCQTHGSADERVAGPASLGHPVATVWAAWPVTFWTGCRSHGVHRVGGRVAWGADRAMVTLPVGTRRQRQTNGGSTWARSRPPM